MEDIISKEALRISSQLEESYTENFQEIAKIKRLIEEAEIASKKERAKGPPQIDSLGRRSGSLSSSVSTLTLETSPDEVEVWHAIFSLKHQSWYYANAKTKETSWTRPEEGPTRKIVPVDKSYSGSRKAPESMSHLDIAETSDFVQKNRVITKTEEGQGTKQTNHSKTTVPENMLRSASAQSNAAGVNQSKPRISRQTSVRSSSNSPIQTLSKSTSSFSFNPSEKPLRVEDWLLMRDVESKRKIQQQKMKMEEQKMHEMRARPKINETSKRIMKRRDHAPIQDRVADVLFERETSQKSVRDALVQKENAEVSGRPVISSMGRQQTRDLVSLLEWKTDRNKKIQTLIQKQDEIQQAELSFKPKICKNSKRLARDLALRRTRSHSPNMHRIRKQTVEDRLFVEASDRRKRQESRIKHFENSVKMLSVPRILPRSRSLKVEEEVYDRLFKLTFQRNQSRHKTSSSATDILMSPSSKSENDREKQSPYQNQGTLHQTPTFAPQINEFSRKLVCKTRPTNIPVEQQLLETHHKYEERRRQRHMKEDNSVKNLMVTKKMSQKSKEMVASMEDRQAVPTVERLYRGISVQKVKKTAVPDEDYSFQPELATKATKTCTLKKSDADRDFYQRNEAWTKKRLDNKQKQQKEIEKESNQECTFKPSLPAKDSGRTKAFMERYQLHDFHPSEDLIARNTAWAQKREETLQKQREKKNMDSASGLTFKPDLFTQKTPKRAVTAQNCSASKNKESQNNIQLLRSEFDIAMKKNVKTGFEDTNAPTASIPPTCLINEEIINSTRKNISDAVKFYIDSNFSVDIGAELFFESSESKTRTKLIAPVTQEHVKNGLSTPFDFSSAKELPPDMDYDECFPTTLQFQDLHNTDILSNNNEIGESASRIAMESPRTESTYSLQSGICDNICGEPSIMSTSSFGAVDINSHSFKSVTNNYKKLCPGWLEFFTDEGVPYYYNALDDTTQWEHPGYQ